ncbi:filaggrin-like [Tigriopus californicus]|uniref:filaggrin-like n=1 Tax=Tigriopus californicus TaxID=6832 RepID=UPI0027D9E430|nr:filaggrin-like [Tigriopus californicus]XP_059084911.1 filaggrin-like [Tigriopus californicus]|eukprot:TCALIF_06780-PA protein Name:"Protein of unknown function" AED:0.03 eAED:0.03 QI:773/1/1/1/0/0/2/626/968
MAWGFWTTYSANTHVPKYTSNFSPPFKRERSLDRDSVVEKERQLLKSSSSAGSLHNERHESAGANGRAPSRLGHHIMGNHIAPEKVAYERHLLLGDPDWSSRTVADRNTLPRKKQYDFERGSVSPSEEVYYSNQKSPVTPMESGNSRKSSDDVFCPACAHQSSSQHNSSNRESRVSFGSIASSSRGSRGSSSGGPSGRGGGGGGGMTSRMRSRSQEDDESSGRGGILSSSVPTPPPPPFLSNRDIIHSSLMETINQKMSILSSIRNALPNTTDFHVEQHHEMQYRHERPQTTPRRHSSRVPSGGHVYNQPPQRSLSSKSGRKASSISLRDGSGGGGGGGETAPSTPVTRHQQPTPLLQQVSDNTSSHPRSSRSSSRTTPRGSSSRASHESIRSIPPTTPLEDGTYERIGDHVDDDPGVLEHSGGSVIGIRNAPKPIDTSPGAQAQTPAEDGGDEQDDQENNKHTGTVKRRKRRSSHIRLSQERLEENQKSRTLPHPPQRGDQFHDHGGQSRERVFFSRYLDDSNGHSHNIQDGEFQNQHYQHHHPRYHRECQSQSGSRKSSQERLERHRQAGRHLSLSQERLEDKYSDHSMQCIADHHHHHRHNHHQQQSADRPCSRSQEEIVFHPDDYRRTSYEDLIDQRHQYVHYANDAPLLPPHHNHIGSQEVLDNASCKIIPKNSISISESPHSLARKVAHTDNGHVYKSSLKRSVGPIEFSHHLLSHSHDSEPSGDERFIQQLTYHQTHQLMTRPNSYHDHVPMEKGLRPRSSSIGDRLSDSSEPTTVAVAEPLSNRQRKHHTLGGYGHHHHPHHHHSHTRHRHPSQAPHFRDSRATGNGGVTPILTNSLPPRPDLEPARTDIDRHLPSMSSFQSTVPSSSLSAASSRSEKSSSRSSQSPSSEFPKPGCHSSRCRKKNSLTNTPPTSLKGSVVLCDPPIATPPEEMPMLRRELPPEPVGSPPSVANESEPELR